MLSGRPSPWPAARPPKRLNAPCGAEWFLTGNCQDQPADRQHVLMHLLMLSAFWPGSMRSPRRWGRCLNAPCGGGCFLTTRIGALPYEEASLNAPSGARCFLTTSHRWHYHVLCSLNAPSGARCFLTIEGEEFVVQFDKVLMHLLVLGAFRHRASTEEST